MNVQSYHDANVVVNQLLDCLRSHLYSGNRKGMIPPNHMGAVRSDIADALATLNNLMEDDNGENVRWVRKLLPGS